MPIKIPDNLPAKQILLNENIFVMDESRAFSQDIRPLKIAILNLMPDKQETEVQLLRLLGNTPLQQEITLLHPETHVSKHTPAEYLLSFYSVFSKIEAQKFDGLIITGAPIENIAFENVSYWQELTRIMEWSKTNVLGTFHICWGAQAGLYYHYGIQKHALKSKMFGIFAHKVYHNNIRLMQGFDEEFWAPHSRHTEILKEDVLKAGLLLLSDSDEAGVYIAASKDMRQVFVTGHSEYDADTLAKEYFRDMKKAITNVAIPKNYFKNDDPKSLPIIRWRAHANLLFSNWLDFIYQETPFNLDEMECLQC